MAHSFEPKLGWNSDSDNILEEFYKPALKIAKKYDRLAGYFSSTTFAIAVAETLDFIERGGVMRLITSAEFSRQDSQILEKSIDIKEKLSKNIFEEFKKNNDLEKKCTSIFGWMLTKSIGKQPQLEIKIAVPKRNGIFHPKIGILTLNNDDIISFSGSVNETGNAWHGNIEEFKVFKDWGDNTSKDSVKHDQEHFERFYSNNAENVSVYDLPKAVREHMIKIRPKSTLEFKKLIIEIKNDLNQLKSSQYNSDSITLRPYQKNAIKLWKNNDFNGILNMATGTGKTYTSFGGIRALQDTTKRLVVIIVTPYKHIIKQWIDNIKKWNTTVDKSQRISDKYVRAYSDVSKWDENLRRSIVEINKKLFSGKFAVNDYIIYTTYKTISSKKFIDMIQQIDSDILLIADEVHWLGSQQYGNGMIKNYRYKLGLSATPARQFDEEGTEKIINYFDGIVYNMGLEEAINSGYLVPYEYHPLFFDLSSKEMNDYRDLTIKLARILHAQKDDEVDNAAGIKRKRAKKITKAEGKYAVLEKLLDSMNNRLMNTLIYCDDNEQLKKVTSILTKRHISNKSIIQDDPTDDRGKIIVNMTRENYNCITAIKCLDEGVDIPSAHMAIIMASTRNSRQYIQRMGRLLRPSPDTEKEYAIIYDMLARIPNFKNDVISSMERKLIARELLRYKEFIKTARNKNANDVIKEYADGYNIDIEQLSQEYIKSL